MEWFSNAQRGLDFPIGLVDSFRDESVTRVSVSCQSWQFMSLAFIIPTKDSTGPFTLPHERNEMRERITHSGL